MGDIIRSTPELVAEAQAAWSKLYKKPNPVYVRCLTEEVKIETDRGTTDGHPGDYIACDPISGQVWPVSAEYLQQHYQAPPPGITKVWLAWT